MICSIYRSLPPFSRNPFLSVSLFFVTAGENFCLGEIFESGKENEKAKPCPNCVTVPVGNEGVDVTPHPPQQDFCHCQVWVILPFGVIAQTP